MAETLNQWGLPFAPAENIPTPDTRYPMEQVTTSLIYLKHFITRSNVSIGDYTYYHSEQDPENFENTNVLYHTPDSPDRLIIGKFCALAQDCQFMMNRANHDTRGSTYPFPFFAQKWAEHHSIDLTKGLTTTLGNDIWVGNGALIMPGVTIGDGAIIGTRTVVAKDVPPYSIVVGNSGRILRQRFSQDIIDRLLELQWWHWDIGKITRNLSWILDVSKGIQVVD